MFTGSTRSAGGRVEPELREQVGDGLREIADIAGRSGRRRRRGNPLRAMPSRRGGQALRGNGRPVPVLYQMRRGAVVAPFMRQRDAQAARIAPDELGIRLRRHPVGHELARRAAAATVDEGRRVAHGAGVAALDRDQPGQVRRMGRDGKDAARRLQPDIAAGPGRDADGAAAIGGVPDGRTPAATIAPVPAEEPFVV